MSVLKFSDGVEIDTSGSFRKLHLTDGWYIVGNGQLIPVSNEAEVDKFLNKLKSK